MGRAQLVRHVELVLVDVDRDDGGAGDPGVLDGHVAEPADPEHCDHVGGTDLSNLDRLVCRHACARQGRRVERVDSSGTTTTYFAAATTISLYVPSRP